ncbi:MAG: hypothetical protein DMC62_06690 [Verrucomicrobia bacterium]|nr:MAG: hypothetical protein DMC62_06690 [Verrucomicrobiota bacterium]
MIDSFGHERPSPRAIYFVAKPRGIAAWSGKRSNIEARLFAERETKAEMQMRRMKKRKAPLK